MNLLAVDTTGESLSLALAAGERVLALTRRSRKPHDETILPAIAALLRRAGLALESIDAIAAASGPGRFTGIRIGMSFAAVAAGRLGKPALAISRLEAAAFSAGLEGRFAVNLAGFRDERFYQIFLNKGREPAAEAGPVWASPEVWAAAERRLREEGVPILAPAPGARELLAPALSRLRRRRHGAFEPLYLKPAGYERSVR